jgi:hypothetical protein
MPCGTSSGWKAYCGAPDCTWISEVEAGWAGDPTLGWCELQDASTKLAVPASSAHLIEELAVTMPL